ncbi:MAG: ParA family protein [Acidobacteria bacterium]|nr:ParA family protein [Acidobacteriota bacterium]MCG3194294.1 Sporulation initiation inhibitor protein Soj [Thermoanaerobaculia bacterium]MCK6681926.1 ParA family protein [Thermoanaerobaculia bacterium]
MIICIANQKGGVGKTTTAINVSAALAQKNLRTLLIDLDPQANSTLSYLDRKSIDKTVFDLLVDPAVGIDDVVRSTNLLNLKVAPSRISLAKVEAKLLGEIDGHFRLKDKLERVKEEFDAVVIDTPPTLGMITVNALVAATHILIPIQSSYFALEGTDDLLETIEKIKGRPNPNLQILGAVITLHDRRTVLGRDIIKQIDDVFQGKLFKTTISKSVRLEESPAYKESIFTFAPRSSGAMEYYSLTEEILARV